MNTYLIKIEYFLLSGGNVLDLENNILPSQEKHSQFRKIVLHI